MTREEARSSALKKQWMAEVELAYSEGKSVESRTGAGGAWGECRHPSFNWRDYEYRVKLPPTHRPFGKGDNLLGFVVREKGNDRSQMLIIERHCNGEEVSYRTSQKWIESQRLLDEYEISVDMCNTWSTAGVPLPKEEQPSKSDPNWKLPNQPE